MHGLPPYLPRSILDHIGNVAAAGARVVSADVLLKQLPTVLFVTRPPDIGCGRDAAVAGSLCFSMCGVLLIPASPHGNAVPACTLLLRSVSQCASRLFFTYFRRFCLCGCRAVAQEPFGMSWVLALHTWHRMTQRNKQFVRAVRLRVPKNSIQSACCTCVPALALGRCENARAVALVH